MHNLYNNSVWNIRQMLLVIRTFLQLSKNCINAGLYLQSLYIVIKYMYSITVYSYYYMYYCYSNLVEMFINAL